MIDAESGQTVNLDQPAEGRPNRVIWMWSGAGVAIVAIVAVVALVLVLRGGSAPVAVAAQITVEEITNRVETERPRESAQTATAFTPAEIGQELLPGDGIKTFVESEARVDIRVQEFLRITRTTPDTIWRLGQFGVGPDTIIELDQGKIFILDEGVPGAGEPLRIVTPAGTASSRGTWMSVEYDKDTGEA